jgi:hypothetical protein
MMALSHGFDSRGVSMNEIEGIKGDSGKECNLNRLGPG